MESTFCEKRHVLVQKRPIFWENTLEKRYSVLRRDWGVWWQEAYVFFEKKNEILNRDIRHFSPYTTCSHSMYHVISLFLQVISLFLQVIRLFPNLIRLFSHELPCTPSMYWVSFYKALFKCNTSLCTGNRSFFMSHLQLIPSNRSLFKYNTARFKCNTSLFTSKRVLFKCNTSLLEWNTSLFTSHLPFIPVHAAIPLVQFRPVSIKKDV